MAKVITVFGATGAQGNPIARALLKSGFKVRAVTRNPDSDKAKALKDVGAEVVKANLNDIASVDAAFQGAYGAFVVTNYVEQLVKDGPEAAYATELKQGKDAVDAAIRAGLKHYVYSSGDPIKEKIGKACPPSDMKVEVEKYIIQCGIPYSTITYAFYCENFTGNFAPQKQDDGTFTITLPLDGPMPVISVEDGGPVVAAIFSNPDEYLGKKVKIAGEKLSIDQIAAIISKFTGKTVKYNQVPLEVYAKFPFPGADIMAAVFEYFSAGHAEANVELTRKINPKTQTFEQWAEQNKDKLLKALS